MDATENVVRNMGWLDECPDGKLEINTTPLHLENDQTASQWKSVVQRKRQELPHERGHHASQRSKYNNKTYSDPNEMM